MRILEEIWYDNIEPTEYDTSSCKEYQLLTDCLIFQNSFKLGKHLILQSFFSL